MGWYTRESESDERESESDKTNDNITIETRQMTTKQLREANKIVNKVINNNLIPLQLTSGLFGFSSFL